MSDNYSLAIVDNTDPDNLACVLALANAQEKSQLLGVIVTGRAAHFDRNASLEETSEVHSSFVTRLNAVRMQNFLHEAGHSDIPVFMGNIAPYTLVPHSVHIDEREFGDYTPEQLHQAEELTYSEKMGLAGNTMRAIEHLFKHLLKLGKQVDIIVGGSMTDLTILAYSTAPNVEPLIRSVHAQFGMFGFGEGGLMEFGDKPRGKRQFNVACDPDAAHQVLMNLAAPVFLYPSDVTRVDSIGFSDPGELTLFLQDTPATRELVRIYGIAYERMIKPRGERIYIHDLAPVLGYLQWMEQGRTFNPPHGRFYEIKRAEITHVPHEAHEKDRWGEIDIKLEPDKVSGESRYVATRVNFENYLSALRELVR